MKRSAVIKPSTIIFSKDYSPGIIITQKLTKAELRHRINTMKSMPINNDRQSEISYLQYRLDNNIGINKTSAEKRAKDIAKTLKQLNKILNFFINKHNKKSGAKKNKSGNKKRTGATAIRDEICKLIIEQKYTINEIMEKIGADKKIVFKMYYQLNNGKRKGFNKPEKPYTTIN